MKILFLGDYSNLHACLAKELRRRGHEVVVVSDRGGHMQTQADIPLVRKSGIIGSITYLLKIIALLPKLKGFDVVQLINPGFFKLRPEKLHKIFNILKKNNRSVFLTLCGNDYYFVKDCCEEKLFRFSEFRIGGKKTPLYIECPERETDWLNSSNRSYAEHVYEEIDGAMSVLPEYDMSARLHMNPEKLVFTNLPIDLESLPYSRPDIDSGRLRILVGIRGGMEIEKGTAWLLKLCRELESEHPERIETKMVTNLPLDEYLEELKKSHLVIDQLYSYSPATNALQTMALGRLSGSGGQEEYYDYIGETIQPVVKLSPEQTGDDIKRRILTLIENPEKIISMSHDGRHLVERHNDVRNIAGIFEDHWRKTINHGN